MTTDFEEQPQILEELASDSSGNGLEAEPGTGAGDIQAPFDPKSIDVTTSQRTVDALLARLAHGELDLSPDFQRRANLWNDKRKSGLIESMLLRIPIPSLYISEDKEGNYQVVDGLQRMCAIAHFVKVSSLNQALDTQLPPLRLTEMQSLKELNRKAFDDLPRPLMRRILETELTLHIIRAGTPPNVKFNIFSKINQGGLPLNAQEIRNAIFGGRWREYIRRMAKSDAFLRATGGNIKGERLEDHELILRFAALVSLGRNEKRGDEQTLDEFLNHFVEERCSHWTTSQWEGIEHRFEAAMLAAPQVFGNIAFRKYKGTGQPRSPINRGLFEAESVALAQRPPSDLERLARECDKVAESFAMRFLDQDNRSFANALLYATGKGAASNVRLEVMHSIFDEVLRA
jgi:hypothetical protein